MRNRLGHREPVSNRFELRLLTKGGVGGCGDETNNKDMEEKEPPNPICHTGKLYLIPPACPVVPDISSYKRTANVRFDHAAGLPIPPARPVVPDARCYKRSPQEKLIHATGLPGGP
ncbi:MAG TPA: hypothetical protein VJ023_17615 [Pyrinomonadaceae bacterium]|nr:hypothetical protein [Pyrinomonadaceae bacterium]